MKERPILMSTLMVQAILEGRKTMTRRTKGVEGLHEIPFKWGLDKRPYYKNGVWMYDLQTKVDDSRRFKLTCPYGQIGDRLWVRETWGTYCEEWRDAAYFQYKASFTGQWDDIIVDPPKWKPSIFMPREASRITLEITNIRVERLQDISEEDAVREGVISTAQLTSDSMDYTGFYATEHFQHLWCDINGPESWKSNPYVWVISFKVINK